MRTPRHLGLRRATGADADALLGLRVLMFEEMSLPREQIDAPQWRGAAVAWFESRLDHPDVHGVVVEIEGEVVAGGLAEVQLLVPGPTTPNGSTGLISNVATLPDHRGVGHGRAVMAELMRWFQEETDVGRVDLFATEAGARIYERFGFATGTQPAMRVRLRR